MDYYESKLEAEGIHSELNGGICVPRITKCASRVSSKQNSSIENQVDVRESSLPSESESLLT